ncbi:hypothetical protein ACCO45_003788 [Purpureocillium lilacinum]|uniref:Uncharacterized protein n=1 Tax=Purpureocillium lilacinum TaxID=33203 RepID=A0ACC4E0X3_PURLI
MIFLPSVRTASPFPFRSRSFPHTARRMNHTRDIPTDEPWPCDTSAASPAAARRVSPNGDDSDDGIDDADICTPALKRNRGRTRAAATTPAELHRLRARVDLRADAHAAAPACAVRRGGPADGVAGWAGRRRRGSGVGPDVGDSSSGGGGGSGDNDGGRSSSSSDR